MCAVQFPLPGTKASKQLLLFKDVAYFVQVALVICYTHFPCGVLGSQLSWLGHIMHILYVVSQ